MSEINLEWFRHVEDTLRNGFCSPNVGCSVNTCACAISEDGADAIASLRSSIAELEKALVQATGRTDELRCVHPDVGGEAELIDVAAKVVAKELWHNEPDRPFTDEAWERELKWLSDAWDEPRCVKDNLYASKCYRVARAVLSQGERTASQGLQAVVEPKP